jgi:hypothetical protein
MRKIQIFLFCLFLIGFKSNAQISLGVVGFPQISTLSNKSDALDNKLSFGGGGGINATYDFSEKFGVQVGVLYSAQNQKIRSNYTISGVGYSTDSRKRFDYLKIPVLLRITQPIGILDFIVFAGPQFSYLLKYDGGMIVYLEDQYFDLPSTPNGNKYYNKYTIDATGGVGFDLPLSKYLKITSAFKVDYNITNAQNNNATIGKYKVSDVNGSGSSVRNMTYALMLGVNFKFKDPNDMMAPSNKFRKKSYGKKKRY